MIPVANEGFKNIFFFEFISELPIKSKNMMYNV